MYEILDFFKRNKYHFIGWVVLIAYEIGAVGFVSGKFNTIEVSLLYYVLNILLFYTHALIVLPSVLNQVKNRIAVLPPLIVVECAIYVLTLYILLPVISNYKAINFQYLIKITWKCVYLIGFSSTYYLFRKLTSENIRNMALEKARFNRIIERKDIEYELIKSNYAYLRAQINPHFLFNLLNFLYDKVKEFSIQAANAMHILSEMMQYSLRTTDKEECVSVSEELNQVKNLIYLNQLRFDNKLQIDLSYSKEALDLKIIPLVLLTLVENMFKHGDLINPGKKASIHVYVANDTFHITAINKLSVIISDTVKYRSGLYNVITRLKLAYNNAALFECSIDGNSSFFVHVTIPVSCLTEPMGFVVKQEARQKREESSSPKNQNLNRTNRVLAFIKKNKYHFIGWGGFMIYEIGVISLGTGKFNGLGGYVPDYILNILFFYIHALIVLPLAFGRPKFRGIILCLLIILECIVYIVNYNIVIPFIVEFFDLQNKVYDKFDLILFVKITWRFLYFMGFSWSYYLIRRLNFKNQQNLELEQARFQDVINQKDIEQELIRSNYAYLNAQINPHFLFNLLNFLYDETKKSSKEVSDAVMALSEMMQYSLGGLQEEFVVMSEEIEQVEHLIYLHQLQLDYTLQIDFNYSDEVVHLEIIPLVLLTLAENMFKHGDLTVSDKRASINLYVENNVFHLITINSLRVEDPEIGHSTGLDNIRKRLAFAYRDTDVLEYTVNENHQFIAQVKIPIQSLANPVTVQSEHPNN